MSGREAAPAASADNDIAPLVVIDAPWLPAASDAKSSAVQLGEVLGADVPAATLAALLESSGGSVETAVSMFFAGATPGSKGSRTNAKAPAPVGPPISMAQTASSASASASSAQSPPRASKRPRIEPAQPSAAFSASAAAAPTPTPKHGAGIRARTSNSTTTAPLAERMRPQTIDGMLGQTDLLGAGAAFRRLIEEDRVPSVIFWGPPGCGKTTICEIISRHSRRKSVKLSAVTSGVGDIRKAVEDATGIKRLLNKGTLLFVDEIHRWSKSQQDALLPHVESGLITLMGATTENPSFALNKALLSRARCVTLDRIQAPGVEAVLRKAAEHPDGLGGSWGDPGRIEPAALTLLAELSDGDCRVALGALEMACSCVEMGGVVGLDAVRTAYQSRALQYDRAGDEHYNTISALHKSMRSSDADAAIYWLARMLQAGDEPVFVARRVVRFAAEDVGLADPQALVVCMAAMDATSRIGMPECGVILAEAVVYCARARKSVAVYRAWNAAVKHISENPRLPVPLIARNAPTKLMGSLGYGKGRVYPPDDDPPYRRQRHSFLPDELHGTTFLNPRDLEGGSFIAPTV